MPYQSIDQMQKLLSENIFAHTESPKKAAGRASGTMVEIIGFYSFKAWGYEYNIAIERPLPEYANIDIKHKFTFIKTNMDFNADIELTHYFIENIKKIETWFNVITPCEQEIKALKV